MRVRLGNLNQWFDTRHVNRGHVRQGGCAMCKPERVREDHPGRAIERELEDAEEGGEEGWL